jgi:hypothetical protein
MKLAVSYDNKGQITLLFDPATLIKNDNVTASYRPAKGENHQVLDVPPGLEGKAVHELASTLYVETNGTAPTLKRRA